MNIFNFKVSFIHICETGIFVKNDSRQKQTTDNKCLMETFLFFTDHVNFVHRKYLNTCTLVGKKEGTLFSICVYNPRSIYIVSVKSTNLHSRNFQHIHKEPCFRDDSTDTSWFVNSFSRDTYSMWNISRQQSVITQTHCKAGTMTENYRTADFFKNDL